MSSCNCSKLSRLADTRQQRWSSPKHLSEMGGVVLFGVVCWHGVCRGARKAAVGRNALRQGRTVSACAYSCCGVRLQPSADGCSYTAAVCRLTTTCALCPQVLERQQELPQHRHISYQGGWLVDNSQRLWRAGGSSKR